MATDHKWLKAQIIKHGRIERGQVCGRGGGWGAAQQIMFEISTMKYNTLYSNSENNNNNY